MSPGWVQVALLIALFARYRTPSNESWVGPCEHGLSAISRLVSATIIADDGGSFQTHDDMIAVMTFTTFMAHM